MNILDASRGRHIKSSWRSTTYVLFVAVCMVYFDPTARQLDAKEIEKMLQEEDIKLADSE